MIKSIVSGKYRVIDSGSIILFDHESSLELTVEVGIGFTIILEIAFASNPDLGRVIKNDIDEKNNRIKFTCMNFDNSLGTGTIQPLEIAKYMDKKVYIHIWTYLFGNKNATYTRKVDYTIYIEQ